MDHAFLSRERVPFRLEPSQKRGFQSQVTSGSSVSSHSRQIQSPAGAPRALSAAGTIVTPHAGHMGGRSSSMSAV
jgi:hypothetical protein